MEKGHFLKGKIGYAVSLSNGGYILETGEVISSRKGAYQDFHHTRNVDAGLRESMMSMANLYEEAIKCNNDMKKLEEAMNKNSNEIAKLNKHNEKLAEQKLLVYNQKNLYISEVDKLIGARKLELDIASQDVDEKSKAEMSFYHGTLNIPRAVAIIRANKKRKIYYRYGFAYRGASKHEISKEQAVSYLVDNSAWTDFYANDKELLINQYSANDMF